MRNADQLDLYPYLEDNIPVLGDHCSWSESSALIYANSILGARTNRSGGEASFFSGLLGITPKYGLHLDENRKGTHLIDVQCEIIRLATGEHWGICRRGSRGGYPSFH